MTLAKGSGAVSPAKIQDATKANKVVLNTSSNQIELTTNSVLQAVLNNAGTLTLGTSSGAIGIEVVRSSASTDFGLKLRNNANGDIKLTLETAAQSYSFGVDNSDNDYLKLSTSSTDVGSNTLWTIKPDGKLGLLTVPTSTLHVAGSIAQTITTLTSATTLDDTHSLVHVNATSGTVNISLPTSVGIAGRSYILMKTDSSANTVVIDANASETISGDLSITLTGQYDWVTLRSDGATWVTEGSNNLEMASICLDSGTISNLPLNFCTDTNTGLYNPGADSLSLVTNGVDRVHINNTGVGIGTSPMSGARLSVSDGSSASWKLTLLTSVSSLIARNHLDTGYASAIYDATQHIFKEAGTETLRFITGKLSLGAGETPLGHIHIKQGSSGGATPNSGANALVLEAAGNTGTSLLTPNTAAGYYMFSDPESQIAGVVKYDHSIDLMSFFTNATPRLYLNATGLGVGISPGNPLDVQAAFQSLTSGNGTLVLRSSDTAAIDKGALLGFVGAFNGSTQTTFAQIAGLKENGTANNYAGYLGFYTRQDGFGTGVERMRLSSIGNLGIGVTPSFKLDVAGSTNLSSGSTYKINSVDVLSSTTLGSGVVNSSLTSVGTLTSLNVSGLTGLGGSAFSGAKLTVSDGTSTAFKFIVSGSSSTLQSRDHVDGSYTPIIYDATQYIFKESGTETLRLLSGKLGIGINAPQHKIHSQTTNADNTTYIETVTSGNPILSLSAAGQGGTQLYHNRSTGDFTIRAEGGADRIVISSAGNLDILTGVLILDSTGSNNGIINNSASIRINIDSNNNNSFETFTIGNNSTLINDSNVLFRVHEDGNVGIGYVTATTKLDVNGTGRFNGRLTLSGIGTSELYTSDASGMYLTAATNGGMYIASDGSFLFRKASTPFTEYMRLDFSGNLGIGVTPTTLLTVNGPIALKAPSTVNASTYTVVTTDSSLRFTTTNCTVTLPTASSFTGRILYINTITANSVDSGSSNVIPLGSDTAGTAILAATAGKFTMLQSNGTNWITIMSN